MIISLFSFFPVFAIRDLYRMFFSSSCSLVIHAHTHIGNKQASTLFNCSCITRYANCAIRKKMEKRLSRYLSRRHLK